MANKLFRLNRQLCGRGGFYPAACALGALTALFLGSLSEARAGLLPAGRDRARGEALLQQATLAYQNGDLSSALGLLDQAETAKPDQGDAWNLRGVIYLKLKDYARAQGAFSRAVAIDPNLWAAQFNLAEMWFQKKDFPRAQSGFDHLLAQTDRYKATSKWELALYKVVLCELLSGNEAGARKALAKLHAANANTPTFIYSQAALAFARKDTTEANRILGGAQKTYGPETNELYAASLQTAGWQALPMTTDSSPVASVDPATAAAMNAAGITNPSGAPAPASSRGAPERSATVIDPRLIAANNPLPGGAGNNVVPVVGEAGSKPLGKNASASSRRIPKGQAAATPTPAPVIAGPATTTTPPPSPLEQEGLLLGLD